MQLRNSQCEQVDQIRSYEKGADLQMGRRILLRQMSLRRDDQRSGPAPARRPEPDGPTDELRVDLEPIGKHGHAPADAAASAKHGAVNSKTRHKSKTLWDVLSR